MLKFTTILVMLVAAALIIADAAYTHKTTTAAEIDNPNTGSVFLAECMDQMQQHPQELQHCRIYLSAASPREESEHINDCCNALTVVEERCRCEVIQAMVDQETKQRRAAGQCPQREESTKSKAEDLPTMCGVPPMFCHIKPVHMISSF